jgi:hypothetical protein
MPNIRGNRRDHIQDWDKRLQLLELASQESPFAKGDLKRPWLLFRGYITLLCGIQYRAKAGPSRSILGRRGPLGNPFASRSGGEGRREHR